MTEQLQMSKTNTIEYHDLLDAAIEVERRLREDTKSIADLITKHGGKTEKEAWKRAIYGSAVRLQVLTYNDKSNHD